MSNDLNDFWDDIKENEKDSNLLIFNNKEMNNSTINSLKTKDSSINKYHNLIKGKNPFLSRLKKCLKNKKSLNNTKIKNSSKSSTNINSSNSSIIINYNRNKGKIIKHNKKEFTSNFSYLKENKKINEKKISFNNNHTSRSKEKEEINKNKNVSKIAINKNKLNYNIIKKVIKNNNKIFEKNKKEKKINLYQSYSELNQQLGCTFKPIIHKCPKFKKVIFNNNSYISLINFNKRMDSARNEKIYKSRIIPFENINYDEVYKNISDRCICLKRNKSNNNINLHNYQKSLSQNEFILYKKNLHNTLMKIKLKKI